MNAPASFKQAKALPEKLVVIGNGMAGCRAVEELLARDPMDGSICRPHRVNPNTGMYRGRQVLDVEA